MFRKLLAIFIIMCAVYFQPQAAFSADKIYLSTGIRDPFTTDNKDGFIDRLVREVFSRVGVEAEIIVYQNSAKSLENANSGIDDGAALRIMGLEKKFPNLIVVPEKLMDNDFVAYSIDDNIKINNWESLNNYNISYISGWQIFKNNTKDHKSAITTKTPQEMFDVLSSGKVDLMLFERWQGLWRAKQLGIKLASHEPPLASMEMFMYLHKKHKAIINDAAAALAEMKKDGTYKKIFDATLTPYQRGP